MTDKFKKNAEEFDGTYPPNWIPEPDSKMLIGTVVGFNRAQTAFGMRPVVLVQSEEAVEVVLGRGSRGEVVTKEAGTVVGFWLLHTVALTQWKRADPKVGERVAIRRLADRESASGQGYADYLIRVDRKAGDSLDVSEFIPEGSEEEAEEPELPF